MSTAFPRLQVLCAASLLSSLALSTGAAAQVGSSDPQINEQTIEEIVVTGSRIKRRDFVTPSPLVTINTEDLEFSGQFTLEEALNQMPQVMPRSGRASNYSDPDSGIGSAELDLRGLGPGRSLVLLNGRRLAPSGIGNTVDLNNIPQFLIDRVEIITGGTSTVYGSDAIAGAVNFITRQDFSGFGVEAGLSMAEPGDAETSDISLAWGHNFANELGNITVYANLLERKSLLAADREHTRVLWVDNWDQGILTQGGSIVTPAGAIGFPLADLGNGPVPVTFDSDGTPREFVEADDLYNFPAENYLQVPLDRIALGVMGHYDLSEKFEAYMEASFVHSDPQLNAAPAATFIFAQVNLDNPVLTPETRQLFGDNYACDPGFACFVMAKRLAEIGPRFKDYERDYSRLVAGFRGELWDDWEIDGWVTYTNESAKNHLRNDAWESRLQQGLLIDPLTNECYDPSDGCVPLNLFGEGNLSTEGVDFIRFEDYKNSTERTQKLVNVFVTGSPMDTWAGPMEVALGAGWRRDEIDHKVDPVLSNGEALSYPSTSPIDGSEEVAEIYAEAVVPLVSDRSWAEYLGLEIGGRYSDYEHAGSSWTYKAGAEWQPVDGLRLRAMRQRSERAPNSNELFEERRLVDFSFAVFDPSDDPCSASADPVGSGNADKCVIQGLSADQVGVFEATQFYPAVKLLGGNPNLVPEVGETWTVGAILSPEVIPNWKLSIDYFSLEVTDTIGDIDASLICFDPSNTSNIFCDNIERDVSGNVVEMTELTSNRGVLETTGIDTQVQFVTELPEFLALFDTGADISLNLSWTHLLTNKVQENPSTEVIDCAGYFGWPCAFRVSTYPEDRVTSNLHYASGPIDLHLTWRWIEGTDSAGISHSGVFGYPDPNVAISAISDEYYLDLGAAFRFGDNLTTRLSVNNILDNEPPQMADNAGFYNTDAGLYDVFGRSYYLRLSAHF